MKRTALAAPGRSCVADAEDAQQHYRDALGCEVNWMQAKCRPHRANHYPAPSGRRLDYVQQGHKRGHVVINVAPEHSLDPVAS